MLTLTDEEYEALVEAADHEPLTSFIRRVVVRYLARRRK
jgi:predicted DNA-binding ribbon-helix-helix protein